MTASKNLSLAQHLAKQSLVVPPNVSEYRSGGIGHIEGDESRGVVGMVPVHVLRRFMEFDRTAPEESQGEHSTSAISGMVSDIQSGKGITEPLMVEYDDKAKWGWLGEGNHRLAAAIQAGLTHVPVRVYGRSSAFDRPERGVGAPLHLSTDFGNSYVPPSVHPHHFKELAP